ncbi:hypothetical protein Ciccas_002711 [Cichlidogyrus casuarinus]|uniref:Phosphatidylinositol-specific phospholipase C X domain-containing protein n=1 Tax=Cichlidogyrus casuarinus TaxID=1844966 RepID=A0ABD2QJM9_9PLAT
MERWMTMLPLELKESPLTDVAIPGSHDSFSYCINRMCAMPSEEDESGCFKFIPKVVSNWSKTQMASFEQQLLAGIRYFDLRVRRDSRDNLFYFVHVQYSGLVRDQLSQMLQFLKNNPEEVIILDFNHIYGFNCDQDYRQFYKLVTILFHDAQVRIFPWNSPSNWGQVPSLKKVCSEKCQILILVQRHYNIFLMDNYFMPCDAMIRSRWPRTGHPHQVESIMNAEYELAKTSGNEILRVFQWISEGNIAEYLFSTLRIKARNLNKLLAAWLEDAKITSGHYGANITIFYTMDEIQLVTACLANGMYDKEYHKSARNCKIQNIRHKTALCQTVADKIVKTIIAKTVIIAKILV